MEKNRSPARSMCEVNGMADTNKTIVMSAEVLDKMSEGTLTELVGAMQEQLYSEDLEKFLNL